MLKKLLKMVLLTLLAYLLQACVSPLIRIREVAPNIALALIAVVSIAMGVKYTLLMSMMVGYLLEIMLPAVSYLNTILYPVCAVLGALVFADKSERKLSENRAAGKKTVQWNPRLRTVLCACMSVMLYEAVYLLYTNLSGVTLDLMRYLRAMMSVAYSTAIAAVAQFPLRRWLGVHKLRRARA